VRTQPFGVFAAVLLTLAAPARAADVARVSLDDAIAAMRHQNPEILAAALKVRAAGGDLLTARALPNPTLSGSVGNFSLGQTNPPGLPVGDTIVGQAGLSEEFVLWGKRGERIAQALGHEAEAMAERADLDRRLVYEVKAHFFDLLAESERLRLARDELARYGETVKVSQARARAGEISPADFDRIALEQRGVEHEVDDAALERRHAAGELLVLLGIDAPDAEAVGSLQLGASDEDVDRLIQQAFERRPDLRAAERAAEAADAALRLARDERWPNVTLGLQYTHSEFKVSGDLGNQLTANFSLPLPVVDQNQGAIERSAAEAAMARSDVAKLKLEIPQEVRTAVASYTTAKQRVRRFEAEFLGRAREARQSVQVSYREGSVSVLELLEAERAYLSTQREYLDALRDAHTAGADIERAAATEVQQ
jgi:cobalt-zinc-cadmium efflux system outer membrane protein